MRNIAVKILNGLAVEIIGKYKPVIIGVTGSAGKSTTCKILCEVLGAKYAVRQNDSAYRTDISIPLAFIGAESGGHSILKWLNVFWHALILLWRRSNFYPDIIILDMEVDAPDDMKNMLEVAHPNIAIFTGLGEFPAHIGNFKSEKHIGREMSLMFKSLEKSELAVLSVDDPFIKDLAGNVGCQTMTFGFEDGVQVKGEEIFLGEKKWRMSDGKIGMSFKISYEGTTIPFRFSYVIGRGQIYAALAGTSVGLHLGMNMVEISQALENFRTLPGRMNLIKGTKDSLVIDDSFNSNPNSALSALETIGKLEAIRKIAVLGDMLELGKYSKDGHKRVGQSIPESVDLVFLYGDMAKCYCAGAREKGMKEKNIFIFKDKTELIQKLKDVIKEGDIVLVKGSRAMKMEDIVRELMLEPERAEELLVK